MNKRMLVVVDMQRDFVTGALGTEEARAVVTPVCEKIRSWNGDICFTMDTHEENYGETLEGERIPVPHCIIGTDGWQLCEQISGYFEENPDRPFEFITKKTFGSTYIGDYVRSCEAEEVVMVGVCTDICIISNAMMIRAANPDLKIIVDASCCAGTTKENHQKALDVMKQCCIDVINEQ